MSNSSSNGGVGILGLLFLLFTGLKLTGYVDWSWWWVTSPLWLPIVGVSIIGLGFYGVYKFLGRNSKRK